MKKAEINIPEGTQVKEVKQYTDLLVVVLEHEKKELPTKLPQIKEADSMQSYAEIGKLLEMYMTYIKSFDDNNKPEWWSFRWDINHLRLDVGNSGMLQFPSFHLAKRFYNNFQETILKHKDLFL